jgi:hypothetical protein
MSQHYSERERNTSITNSFKDRSVDCNAQWFPANTICSIKHAGPELSVFRKTFLVIKILFSLTKINCIYLYKIHIAWNFTFYFLYLFLPPFDDYTSIWVIREPSLSISLCLPKPPSPQFPPFLSDIFILVFLLGILFLFLHSELSLVFFHPSFLQHVTSSYSVIY